MLISSSYNFSTNKSMANVWHSNKIQRTLNCDELETIQLFQIMNKQFECRCEKHAHTSAHRHTPTHTQRDTHARTHSIKKLTFNGKIVCLYNKNIQLNCRFRFRIQFEAKCAGNRRFTDILITKRPNYRQ